MILPGEKDILKTLNQDTFNIFQYDEIVDIHIQKEYDEISEMDMYKGYLIVTDGNHKIKIELNNIHGDFRFYLGDHLDGFTIEDCSDRGFEIENKYHIYDFEDYDNLNIYCEDLFISLVTSSNNPWKEELLLLFLLVNWWY